MGKGESLQQMVLGKLDTQCKRTKLDPYLTSYMKINSKWIKHLNVRPKTIKLQEENTGGKLRNIGLHNDILDMTLKAQATKVKIDKWLYNELKNVCASKETINRVKRQPIEQKTCKPYI